MEYERSLQRISGPDEEREEGGKPLTVEDRSEQDQEAVRSQIERPEPVQASEYRADEDLVDSLLAELRAARKGHLPGSLDRDL